MRKGARVNPPGYRISESKLCSHSLTGQLVLRAQQPNLAPAWRLQYIYAYIRICIYVYR